MMTTTGASAAAAAAAEFGAQQQPRETMLRGFGGRGSVFIPASSSSSIGTDHEEIIRDLQEDGDTPTFAPTTFLPTIDTTDTGTTSFTSEYTESVTESLTD